MQTTQHTTGSVESAKSLTLCRGPGNVQDVKPIDQEFTQAMCKIAHVDGATPKRVAQPRDQIEGRTCGSDSQESQNRAKLQRYGGSNQAYRTQLHQTKETWEPWKNSGPKSKNCLVQARVTRLARVGVILRGERSHLVEGTRTQRHKRQYQAV